MSDPTPAEAAMMQSSKKKKSKGQTMHLSEFAASLPTSSTSWADEMSSLPTGPSSRDEFIPTLPTGPSRGAPASAPARRDEPPRGGYSDRGGYSSRGGYSDRGDSRQDDRGYAPRGGYEDRRGDRPDRRESREEERAPRDLYEYKGFQIDRNARPPKSEFPTQAPFKAYIGNLPYQMSESEINNIIQDLFRDLTIVDSKMVKDHNTGRLKGFGYVEFKELDQLKEALKMNGAIVQDRSIRVDLVDSTPASGAASDDWRTSRPAREERRDERRFDDRRDDRRFEERRFDDRHHDRRYDDRRDDRRFDDRHEREPREFREPREPRELSKSDTNDDWRSNREARAPPPPRQYRDQQPGENQEGRNARGPREGYRSAPRDGPQRDRPRSEEPPQSSEGGDAPARPRLNLKPRSEKAEGSASIASSNKPNPFGAAKPRDEQEAQRQVEERRKAREQGAAQPEASKE